MSRRVVFALLIGVPACSGCGKSTDELIGNLKAPQEGVRVSSVRLLQGKGDPAKVVPALIGSLSDKEGDVRWSAAIGLGYFGGQAKAAIPALEAAQKDHDARVREGARVALYRIDPDHFPDPYQKKAAEKKQP
jgi:HEAT repeat protein